MKNKANSIQINKLVDRIFEEGIGTSDMFGENPNTTNEITPYLLEMFLTHHSDLEFIYLDWTTRVFDRVWDNQAQASSRRDDFDWLVLQTRVQCEMLSYNDGESVGKSYRARVEQDPTPAGVAVDSLLKVLDDDPSNAIKRYQFACESLGTPSEPALIQGLPSLFYALALHKVNDSQNLVQDLSVLASGYQTAFPGDLILPLLETLRDFALVRSDVSSVEKLGWLVDNYRTASPWFVLLRCVCLHWLQLKPTAAMLTALAKHLKKAVPAEAFWYVQHAQFLQDTYGQKRQLGYRDPFESSWLADYIKPVEDWRVRLRQIEAISAHSRPGQAVGAAVAEQRLIWLLGDVRGILQLEPRLQKLAKNGRWSKGRIVSPSALFDEQSAVADFIDASTRAFIVALEVEYNRSYTYADSREPIRIAQPKLFRMLEEISGLYRVENGGNIKSRPMTLKVIEPSLEIIEDPTSETTHIRLIPFPPTGLYHERPWIMDWVAPYHLQITVFSSKQQELADSLGDEGLHIPAEGKSRVLTTLQNLVPLANVLTDIDTKDLSEIENLEPETLPHIELSPLENGLIVEIKYYPLGSAGQSVTPGEGPTALMASIDNQIYKTVRDRDLELNRAKALIEKIQLVDIEPIQGDFLWHIEDPQLCLELLTDLQGLEDEVTVSWPKDQRIVLPKPVYSKQMSVKIGGNQDWLELDGELQIDENQVLKMDALLRLMDISANGRFITLDDGRMLALSKRLQSQLTALRSTSDNGKVHTLASAVIDEATDQMTVTGGKAWRNRLERLREAQTLNPKLPKGLNVQLRDYQLQGYQWMMQLAHWGAGACLADDMGLGKTVQALAVIVARANLGPALVIAPTSVCNNWVDEINRFAALLNIKQLGEGDRVKMITESGAGDVLISSYGLLQNEIDTLAEHQWSTVIADEAQAFKNANTRRSKAMMRLQADCRIITTGTPIENHLGELWNLFRFINPGLLGGLDRFNERFASPIELRKDDQARQQLKALVRPFILRRLKKEVLKELPSRTEITQLVELDAKETAFYEAIRRQSMERISAAGVESDQRFRILAEITRLRQACCHPKLVVDNPPVSSAKMRAFSEIISELRNNNHRCLVFSQFVGHLTILREYLDENKISYQYLDGSTPAKKRKKAVDNFQNGEGEVFLISLKAGGSGLNLTAANYVIHMDPWWNPAVEDQASDRAHRMGQTQPVTIYRLVVKDTIEEKIVALHANKRDLADGLLEGADSGVRLSVDDLMQLIKED